jgi:lipopolysaccharide export system permease protein
MFYLYQRYMLRHLLLPTIAITLSLTGIIWLTQMLRFIDFMINRGLSLSDFLYLTGLLLPSLLLILLPIGACIATLYTYQKLSNESELVVLASSGVSSWQLARPAIMLGGIIALICYILGLYLMPLANHKFRDIRTIFRDQYASVLLEEEVFNSPVKGLTVFVRERASNGDLSGVLLHDIRKGTILTMIANEGRLQTFPDASPRFLLKDGLRQEKKPDGSLSWLSFDEYAVDLGFYASVSQRRKEADERTLFNLFDTQGIAPHRVKLAIAESHQRLSWPLFGLALPLLMAALLQSSEYNRRGQNKRIILSVIMAAVAILGYFGLKSAATSVSALLPLLYLWQIAIISASCYVLIAAKILPDIPFHRLNPKRLWSQKTTAIS